MESLEHEYKKLDVSRPNQRKDESKSAESSNENAPAAAESLLPLDHFIQDLNERKGKLPCGCQEVTDIQTSVENFLKALLLEIKKDLPFFKTTLINSGSFYEGTKVGKPDEFDYFVQLDNFSQDIRSEELKHGMVAVIPSESAFQKLSKVNHNIHYFDWKENIKSPFVEALDSKLVKGFEAFGLKVLSEATSRHGPAYTLDLKWTGGELFKGLNIAVDLVLAVKINSHSSTMKVDFESQAGRVVKSLLDTLPYYFAVSGYKEYPVSSSSNLFKEFKEEQEKRSLGFPVSESNISLRISLKEFHCLLRISQSSLEQSLFRDHFGPDGGPSVCLRVLKNVLDFIDIDKKINNFVRHTKLHSPCGVTEPDMESSKYISSYTLKTLTLFEWSKNPEEKQWTGSNLTQRIVNIFTGLLDLLKQNKGIRSFWYEDYNVLPADGESDVLLSDAINRVTIILKCISSLRNASKYCFKNCVQTLKDFVKLARCKTKLTSFLHSSLEGIFNDKIREVLEESVGKTKKKGSPPFPKGPRWKPYSAIVDVDFFSDHSVFCGIYIRALLEKIAPEEDFQILSSYFQSKDDSIFVSGTDSFTMEEAEEIVKNSRHLFEEIARDRMNDLKTFLPDYSLWSRDFKHDEVADLLKLLRKNFEKDLEILRNKLKTEKVSRKPGTGV
ncbi:unnamed protein product [Porites lobata]|uniref:Mab-21-like HhH/H2TH-like domain-containing protein n=1 Tax=Porites lobata TaxID=104759 RepID=A0ABN8QCP8_9CNID|nr:unnamed protein product [Porites lobata]